jgi:hypothetical protein
MVTLRSWKCRLHMAKGSGEFSASKTIILASRIPWRAPALAPHWRSYRRSNDTSWREGLVELSEDLGRKCWRSTRFHLGKFRTSGVFILSHLFWQFIEGTSLRQTRPMIPWDKAWLPGGPPSWPHILTHFARKTIGAKHHPALFMLGCEEQPNSWAIWYWHIPMSIHICVYI